MIKLPQPSMALNSDDVPGARYRMYNTYDVGASHTPDHFLGWTATVARSAPGKALNTVVLNCHGFYGTGAGGKVVGGFGLKMGTGVRRADTRKFSVLRGLVANIWITACGTARISGSSSGDGHALCSEIAVHSGAHVLAGTTHQVGALWLPENYVDDFEGLVVRYNPQGTIDWHYDYGRTIVDGLLNGWD